MPPFGPLFRRINTVRLCVRYVGFWVERGTPLTPSRNAYLDGVRVGGLAQDLEQRRVGHKEEPGEQQSLLLQVSEGETRGRFNGKLCSRLILTIECLVPCDFLYYSIRV